MPNWKKLITSGSDATLNSLEITQDLTVDTNTLYVDSSNNRVGIGTTSPISKLDVTGAGYFSGESLSAGLDQTYTNIALLIDEGDYIYTKDSSTTLRKLIGKAADVIYIGQSGTSLIDGIVLQPGTTNGYVSFYDDNSEYARFQGGSLGIGTSSPSYPLHVNGGALNFIAEFQSTDDKASILIQDDDTLNYIHSQDGYLSLGGQNALNNANLNINSSTGNVGIGTTSPSYPLHVNSGTTNQTARFESSDNGALISIKDDDTTTYVGAENSLAYIGSTASASSNNLIINGSGYVGIGTTNPTTRLYLKGYGSGDGEIKIDSSAGNTSFGIVRFQGDGSTYEKYLIGYNSAHPSQANELSLKNTAGDITFHANTGGLGTERMRITSVGKVGIGTTSPARQLHVNSGTTNEVARFESTDGTAYLSIMDNNTANSLQGIGSSGDNLTLYANNAERMRIDSSGNVGIGTSSPSTTLDVVSSINGINAIVENDTHNAIVQILASVNAKNSELWFGDGADSDVGKIDYDHANNSMAFTTNAGERMRIDSSGNVGIGTTSPDDKLHVNGGNIRIQNNSPILYFYDNDVANLRHRILGGGNAGLEYSADIGNVASGYHRWDIANAEKMRLNESGNLGIGTTTPSYALDIERVTGEVAIQLQARDDVSNTAIYFGDNSDADIGSLIYNQGSNYMSFTTNTGERMRIDSSGNIGIGTSSPSEKLDVNGNVTAVAYYGDGSNLTGIGGGVTINNNTNDYLLTATGTANTINGESNLRFNGSTLSVTGSLGITQELTVNSASIDYLAVNDRLQGNGPGFQFFAYNEDTIKVKFANWYSSNARQYGMGQLWFETWFAAIDNGANRDARRIGFYLEEPDAGSTDSGTPGQHPSNARFYVDIDGAYLSGSLDVDNGASITGSVDITQDLTVDTNTFHVDSSNNRVGIGTTSPSSKLHVVGDLFVKGSDTSSTTKNFHVQTGNGTSIMDFRNDTYAFFGCGQGGGSASGFIFRYNSPGATQFAGYNYGNGTSPSYQPIYLDTDSAGRGQGIFINYASGSAPGSTEFAVRGTGTTSSTFTAKFQDSNSTDVFTILDNGDVRAAGDITAYYSSDKNLKTNIQPLENPIEKINQVGGYTFDWKPESGKQGQDVGVVAQEIEAILPEVVTTRETGVKAVKYEKIIPLLIECIKDQQKQIDELKTLIK